MKTRNFYAILGVVPTATEREMRSAYRRRSLAVHPDRRPEHDRERSSKIMADLNRAYSVLVDASLRHAYDTWLRWQQRHPASRIRPLMFAVDTYVDVREEVALERGWTAV